ncbi:MAG: hypothetical protein ACKO96_38020, partial [Flammeovirgaceae bacterium]
MKNTGFIIVILIAACHFGVSAQGYTFKVMANKGLNEVKSGSAWQAIKTGDKLDKDDELKVAENAYVALVHSTGRPIELKEAKTYKIAELIAKVGPGASVVSKYTDFILSSNSDEAKKNRMNATGAVHRGPISEIDVYLSSEFGYMYNDLVYLNWESKTSGPFEVIVKDMFDTELLKISTDGYSTQISRNDPKIKNQDFSVEIRRKGDNTGKDIKKYFIKNISGQKRKLISEDMSKLGEDIQQPTAINKLIMAAFYEQHQLYSDAIGAYEEA